MPNVLNLALKALEMVSVSKQKFYILNQKELKLLVTKNRDCNLFREKIKKTQEIYQISFLFFLVEKYTMILRLAISFQHYKI